MRSPFAYGSIVQARSFTNRKKEIAQLHANFLSTINISIISPRRWGKSSLVEIATKKFVAKHPNYRVVTIDLFSVRSEQAFLTLYAREVISASTTKWEEFVKSSKTLFNRLIPKISMSVGPGEVSLEFDQKNIIKHKDEILNLTEKIAKKKKLKFIICMDEFQNIKNFDKDHAFEKALRANWQRHKHTVFCFYGSKRHMMKDIFNDPSRAFYRFGDVLLLQKIETKEWQKFIKHAFTRTKKKITDAQCIQIAETMRNHSWYVQQYAHNVWLRTDKTTTDEILKNALDEIKRSQVPFFEQLIESLSSTQINLLKAVAKGETQLTAAKTMQNYKLGTPNNVRKNYKSLNEKDIVDEFDDAYMLLDPIFEQLFYERVLR